jgi:hypothetical protein
MQFDITVPADFTMGSVTPGTIVSNAGKSIGSSVNGNVWTFIVYGLNQSVIASGTLMTVQIQISPMAFPGAISLPISNVVFSDPNGVAIAGGASSGGSVTVTAPANPPFFMGGPQDLSVLAGQDATFSVLALGDAPLTYLWQIKGSTETTFRDLPGSNTANILLFNVQSSQSGSQVRCIATNSAGTATSPIATLTVVAGATGPTITQHPASLTVAPGQLATFTVSATGTAPLNYLWQIAAPGGSFGDFPMAMGDSFSLTADATWNGYQVRVIVSNVAGSSISNAATLTVAISTGPCNPPVSCTAPFAGCSYPNATSCDCGPLVCVSPPQAPSFMAQPQDQVALAGGTATFSLIALGDNPLNYDWQTKPATAPGFVSVPGSNNSSFNMANLQVSDSGTEVRCVVSNGTGSVTSNVATLTVQGSATPPAIVLDPVSQTAAAGQLVIFSVAATGTGPLSYMWQIASPGGPFVDFPFGMGDTFMVTADPSVNGNQYRVVVSNLGGFATSAAATLTVTGGGSSLIADAGPDQTITLPASANLQGSVLGSSPFTLINWSKVSGPGTVTFADSAAPVTTADFSQAGLYVLQLAATDGPFATSLDTVQVTVDSIITPPPPAAPVISSTGTASGTVGSVFTYQIVASNSPTSYNATGLPGSLTINSASGLISGTPTAAGNSTITLSATNAGGTGTQTLNLTITTPATNAPTLSVGSVTGQAGTSVNVPLSFNPNAGAVTGIQFSLTVPAGVSTGAVTPGAVVTNAGKGVSSNLIGNTWTFIVFGLNQTPIASGSLMTLQMPIGANTAAGNLPLSLSGVVYTDANGLSIPAGVSTGGILTVTAGAGTAPAITQQPQDITVTLGQTATFSVSASGSAPLSYQWQYALPGSINFFDFPGATASSYTTPAATSALDGYQYRVRVTNSAGSVTSLAALLTVTTSTGPSVTLPTPDLRNLPAYLPVNGSLSAGYPAGYPTIQFIWSISLKNGPSTNQNPYSPSSIISRAQSANFQTSGKVAGLASYNLVPGVYVVTVQAIDINNTNNRSALAQQDVTLLAADFSGLRAFPNPWRSDRNAATNVTFDHLPIGSTVKIFTVSGHWVKTLPAGAGSTTWDLTADNGDKVASGIYLYIVSLGESDGYGGGDMARGKLVVIK